jgi:hypothetical protein
VHRLSAEEQIHERQIIERQGFGARPVMAKWENSSAG